MHRIVYEDWIERQMLRDRPEDVFVFGDNAYARVNAAMRGEPNAIGIATKWAPAMQENAFFERGDRRAKAVILGDLSLVEAELAAGRSLHVPRDGLGTGLSELPQRTPDLYRQIFDAFQSWSRTAEPPCECPWETPT